MDLPDLHPALVERSLFRSRVRTNVALALLRHGPLHARQLQRATGHAAQHIHAALHGEGGAYSRERSLVGLGLVARIDGPEGAAFALTPPGRAEAARALARERMRLARA